MDNKSRNLTSDFGLGEIRESSYVTLATLKSVCYKYLDLNEKITKEVIFLEIYKEDLTGLLSEVDAVRLYVQKMVIEGLFEDLDVNVSRIGRPYIFDVGVPKFHKDFGCKYLKADFENFIIPVEISGLEKGKQEMVLSYCNQPEIRRTFNKEKPDVFWAKVGAKFKIYISPVMVSRANSGLYIADIESLENKIGLSVSAAMEMLRGEFGGLLKLKRYAPSLKKALSGVYDVNALKKIEEFFKIKMDVIKNLSLLYFSLNNGQILLPNKFLLQVGLEPCLKCNSGVLK